MGLEAALTVVMHGWHLQEAEAKEEARREKLHTRQREMAITFDIAGRKLVVERQPDDPRALLERSTGGASGGATAARQPSVLAQPPPPSHAPMGGPDSRMYANDTLSGRAQEVRRTVVVRMWLVVVMAFASLPPRGLWHKWWCARHAQVYQSLTKHFDKLRKKKKIGERGREEGVDDMGDLGQGRVQWENDPLDMMDN